MGPGNPASGSLGLRVRITNHRNRRGQSGVKCEVIDDVDEDRVNRLLDIGSDLGHWGPTNQCRSFAADVLGPPRDATDKPYIGYPHFGVGRK